MKVTKATIEYWFQEKGWVYLPVSIEGIPDGFAWYEDVKLTVRDFYRERRYIVFIPLAEQFTGDWQFVRHVDLKVGCTQEEIDAAIKTTEEEIVEFYKPLLAKVKK